jgi:molybdopterin-guanine dinucleotide biosynthesis protein A
VDQHPAEKPAAIILCGGQSQRMGRPKAWLPFGPETLLERVIRLVSQAADPIIVVAAPDQSLPDLPEQVIIARDPIPNRGPLQGLATGFAALPPSSTLAYATATDAPFLNPAWITYLATVIENADLAIPQVAGRFHPLAALYRPATTLPKIQALLAQNQLPLLSLLDHLSTRTLTETEMQLIDPQFETLINLNTPEEYLRSLAQVVIPNGPE